MEGGGWAGPCTLELGPAHTLNPNACQTSLPTDMQPITCSRLGRRCLISALARACHTQDPVAYVSCEGSRLGYVVASRVVARACHTQDLKQNGLNNRNSKPFLVALWRIV